MIGLDLIYIYFESELKLYNNRDAIMLQVGQAHKSNELIHIYSDSSKNSSGVHTKFAQPV